MRVGTPTFLWPALPWRPGLLWRVGPAALAAAAGGAYLVLTPHTGDIAAHEFRAELFGREGFTIWNGLWYGGHHTPAYSVLWPPLAWLLGPQFLAALSVTVAVGAFEVLVHGHFGARARLGALWFGAGTATVLAAGQLPFALGLAIGLGALVALQRRRQVLAAFGAALCALASPLAALFLALAGVAHEASRRGEGGAGVAAAALAPALGLAAAFPEGGHQPFRASAFLLVVLLAGACAVAARASDRALRVGALLYGGGAIAALLVPTPVGGNAGRLAVLFGGPVLACLLLARVQARWHLLLVAPLLAPVAFWQWTLSARAARSVEAPSARQAFYEPLLSFLDRQEGEIGRVEIPLTAVRREVAAVALRFPLARGWERQLDTSRNRLFYDDHAGHSEYAAWLAENAVRFVALPLAPLDYSAWRERALIEQDPSYIEKRWETKDWRVYEVTIPHPLVVSRHRAVRPVHLGPDSFTLRVRRPGSALVRVRWSPYWRAESGCVEPAGDWTRVTARRPGRLRVTMSFSPERLVSRGRRCA